MTQKREISRRQFVTSAAAAGRGGRNLFPSCSGVPLLRLGERARQQRVSPQAVGHSN